MNDENEVEDAFIHYKRVANTYDGKMMIKDLFNYINSNRVTFTECDANKALFQAGQADVVRYIKSNLANEELED